MIIRDTLRAAMSRADKTVTTIPMAEVTTLKSWDELARQINKARTYLVQVEAEEHRCELALEESRKEREQATMLFEEAKRQFAQLANDALGIGLSAPTKDPRIDALLEDIEREG